MDYPLNYMDELFGLLIALDRQVVQENWKQAYVIARKLHFKVSAVMDSIQLQMLKEDELEPVRGQG
ncbi:MULTISPECIES: hypothetical protein [unclassified Archaeoglobus]|jgi:hypothetical protein|uniref:hypothetical protein n=1 Tax=unclassified Archaeoglobus TaxID=2643606 RepID=UPI0025C3F91C|nr:MULTISPECIES: hypothetical protein [unclassified Archaeoglobus]